MGLMLSRMQPESIHRMCCRSCCCRNKDELLHISVVSIALPCIRKKLQHSICSLRNYFSLLRSFICVYEECVMTTKKDILELTVHARIIQIFTATGSVTHFYFQVANGRITSCNQQSKQVTSINASKKGLN